MLRNNNFHNIGVAICVFSNYFFFYFYFYFLVNIACGVSDL